MIVFMYFLQVGFPLLSVLKTHICNNFASKPVTVELLHARLGYVPLKILKLLDITCSMHEFPTSDNCHIDIESC